MANRQFRIALMRERAGFSQQEAADALGIKKGRYGDWERETREINLRDAIRLADLFNCSLDELAGHEVRTRERPPVSVEEMAIIDAYHSDRRTRRTIDHAVADYIEDTEDEALEKKEVI